MQAGREANENKIGDTNKMTTLILMIARGFSLAEIEELQGGRVCVRVCTCVCVYAQQTHMNTQKSKYDGYLLNFGLVVMMLGKTRERLFLVMAALMFASV